MIRAEICAHIKTTIQKVHSIGIGTVQPKYLFQSISIGIGF